MSHLLRNWGQAACVLSNKESARVSSLKIDMTFKIIELSLELYFKPKGSYFFNF